MGHPKWTTWKMERQTPEGGGRGLLPEWPQPKRTTNAPTQVEPVAPLPEAGAATGCGKANLTGTPRAPAGPWGAVGRLAAPDPEGQTGQACWIRAAQQAPAQTRRHPKRRGREERFFRGRGHDGGIGEQPFHEETRPSNAAIAPKSATKGAESSDRALGTACSGLTSPVWERNSRRRVMIAWRSLFTESARAFGVGVTVRLCLGLSVGTARAARCQISAVEAKPHPKVDNARRPS